MYSNQILELVIPGFIKNSTRDDHNKEKGVL